MKQMKAVVAAWMCIGLLAGTGWAGEIRKAGLGNESLLLPDRNSEITLYNLGNPSGLVLTSQESFVELEGTVKTQEETQVEYQNGRKLQETTVRDQSISLTPNQGTAQTLMYWINPTNVFSLTAAYQGSSQDVTMNPVGREPIPSNADTNYLIQGQYAMQLEEIFQLGLQLGYRGGTTSIADQTFTATPGLPPTTLSGNQIAYDLLKYNVGLSCKLPSEVLGKWEAGLTFKSFDQNPFRHELTGLLFSTEKFFRGVENIFLSGFEYDMAGGYHLNQKYHLTETAGAATAVYDVTNEVTPRGNEVAFQSKWAFLDTQTLGVNLSFPFADITTKKEYRQAIISNVSTGREEGKSGSVSGMHLGAEYLGSTSLDESTPLKLVYGGRLSLAQENVKQYDYINATGDEIGSYQVSPSTYTLGVGVQPQKNTSVVAEFELADSAVKVDQLTLNSNSQATVSPATESQIKDSKMLHRITTFRLAGEFPATEQAVIRGGYSYNKITNEYSIPENLKPTEDLSPGSRTNPNLIDHVFSLGFGAQIKEVFVEGYGALHMLGYDPATVEESGSKTERSMSAWELGVGLRWLL